LRRLIVVRRYEWVGDHSNSLDIKYHDAKWGIPFHDDSTLFEFLISEGAQAGIS
jgi:DNA-3-methyladenine glycosylase I